MKSVAETAASAAQDLRRRDFLALPATGLLVFFHTEPAAAYQEPEHLPARQGYPSDFNAYLRIGGDGRVTCFVGKVELGQGSMTALGQLLAEELDVALDSVDMVMGDTDVCPWDMGTFGSLSIRQFGPVLRRAGAEARAVLLEMAAEQLQVPVDRLQVKAGVVTDRSAPDKHVTYAELVEGKRIERHIANVPVKSAVGVQRHRAVAAPQGCAGENHRQGQIRWRFLVSGNAARAHSPAAGARRHAEERRHLGRREAAGRPSGARWRPDRRAARAARPGRPGAGAGQGGVRPPEPVGGR